MFGVENEHLENDTDLMDEKSSGCRKPAAGCVIFVEQVICATLIWYRYKWKETANFAQD